MPKQDKDTRPYEETMSLAGFIGVFAAIIGAVVLAYLLVYRLPELF